MDSPVGFIVLVENDNRLNVNKKVLIAIVET